MTSRLDFRTLLRETLTSPVQWPDATLNAWINAAILDYSGYFPYEVHGTIDCVAGQRVYSISGVIAGPEDFMGITRVEFPRGLDPIRYLTRRSERAGDFLLGQYYDVRNDTLVLSELPVAGDQIKVWYRAPHTKPAADASQLTIPDTHLDVLRLYVVWQAVRELEAGESADPDTTSTLLSQFSLNAFRLERAYKGKILALQATAQEGGYASPWSMDEYDRIY